MHIIISRVFDDGHLGGGRTWRIGAIGYHRLVPDCQIQLCSRTVRDVLKTQGNKTRSGYVYTLSLMEMRKMQEDPPQMTQLAELGNGAHAFAMRFLGSSADAADAVHDAFTTALCKPDAFDPSKGSLRVWFLGIVRFRCLDMLRQRRASDSDVDSLAVAGPGPAEIAERNADEILLHRALSSLRRDQQEIIVLRDFMDLSYIEIAQTLELPAGTVMSRLHRARLALKEAFERNE